MKNQTKRRRETIRIFLTVTMLLFAVLIAFPKAGEAIPITGTGALGSFSGDLTYVVLPDGSATLTVTLANTSTTESGGYLTGFALNNPSDQITGVTLTDTSGFDLLGGKKFQNTINLGTYGKFDIGASVDGKVSGLKETEDGIGAGQTATFVFLLTGKDLNTLTAESFLSELSEGRSKEKDYQAFVAMFRGFEDDRKGDVVPGSVAVPEPGTLILVGAGLLGLGVLGIRKFRGKI